MAINIGDKFRYNGEKVSITQYAGMNSERQNVWYVQYLSDGSVGMCPESELQMTLEELLAHNYPIVKNGDWIGFRVSYVLENDNTISSWWEITQKDLNNKKGFYARHSTDERDTKGGTGLFTTDNIRQYWERQLMWFYEKAMKNAENR